MRCSQCGVHIDYQQGAIFPVCDKDECLKRRDAQYEQVMERLKVAAFIQKLTRRAVE